MVLSRCEIPSDSFIESRKLLANDRFVKKRLDVQNLVISAAIGLSLFAAQAAKADLYMQFGTKKSCLQTAPFAQNFTKGTFEVLLRDGLIIIDGSCVLQPKLIKFGPDPIFCPLGSTGFIATGDFDRDGTRDDLQYWSFLGDIPAFTVEPYRPDLVFLNSAPPSTLPRPLGLFRDDSVTSFYNVLSPILRQYDQSRYELIRKYGIGGGELARMGRDLPVGQYEFTYPRLNLPTRSVAIPVTLIPFVDPFQATQKERDFFRITNGHWNAGSIEMDPRLINTITWKGNSSSVIRPGPDQLHFGIYDADDALLTFPESGEIQIPNPLTTSYNIPPFFYDPGDVGVANLRFNRNLRLNNVGFDVSERKFKFKLKFIDTYAGYAALTFPLGTATSRTRPTSDYDLDGYTNLVEYAYQSDLVGAGKVEPNLGDVINKLAIPPFTRGANLHIYSPYRLIFPKYVSSLPNSLNVVEVKRTGVSPWVQIYPGPGSVTVADDGVNVRINTTGIYDNQDTTLRFRLVHYPVTNPLLAGSYTVTNLGGNIQEVKILKRPATGGSLSYGIERKNGTRWVAEKIPTVVGVSNGRWKLNVNSDTQYIFTSVIPLPIPLNEFRPAAKSNY